MNKYIANTRIVSGSQTGISRYVSNLIPHLSQFIEIKTPAFPIFYKGVLGHIWDIFAFIKYRNSNVWLTSHRGSPFLTKYIITIHDLQPILSRDSFNFLYSLYYQILIKYHATKSKHIFTPSEKVKSDIISNFKISPSKISVVYPGYEHLLNYDVTNCCKNISDDYALMYGNISRIKLSLENIIFWLESNINNDLKLVLIGNIERKIESSFRNLLKNNLKKLIYIQNVSDDKLFCYLRNSKYLYFNSPNEGFGIPALEAVYYRIPVLYSANSSVSEFILGYGVGVDPKCYRSIEAGLHKILSINVTSNEFEVMRSIILEKCSWKRSANIMINNFSLF